MATISDNTQGNKYHSENDGKFISPNEVGGNSEQQKTAPKLKLKKGVDIEALKLKVEELKQISNIPYLKSAQDVVNYFPKFFVKGLVEDIDKIYGKELGSRPYICSPFKFRDGREGLRINLFSYMLGKHRYKTRGSEAIDFNEYNRLKSIIDRDGSGKFSQYRDQNGSRSRYVDRTEQLAQKSDIGCGMVLGYRGIPVHGNDMVDIGQNYIGEGSMPAVYGEQGCYGTVHYVAMSESYAKSYAGYGGHIYKHIIDVKNSNVLYEHELYQIQRDLKQNSGYLQQMAEQHFSKFVDSNRARELAQGFVGSINYDQGFVAVMLGADCLVAGIGNGHQIDLLNFGKAKILKDW